MFTTLNHTGTHQIVDYSQYYTDDESETTNLIKKRVECMPTFKEGDDTLRLENSENHLIVHEEKHIQIAKRHNVFKTRYIVPYDRIWEEAQQKKGLFAADPLKEKFRLWLLNDISLQTHLLSST